MTIDIATVVDRVSVDDVIAVNNIATTIDTDFVTKHLEMSRIKIKLQLGEYFTIAGTSYPELYDDAVAKKTYTLMLPLMHTFYKQEYPSSSEEMDEFFMTPTQVNAIIAELEEKINENIQILKDEISIGNGKSINAGGLVISAAGANPRYKTQYINEDADNNDK